MLKFRNKDNEMSRCRAFSCETLRLYTIADLYMDNFPI